MDDTIHSSLLSNSDENVTRRRNTVFTRKELSKINKRYNIRNICNIKQNNLLTKKIIININSLDINECVTVSPCHVNATCDNTEGSYICTCDTGYSGDGFTCDGKKIWIFMKITTKKQV